MMEKYFFKSYLAFDNKSLYTFYSCHSPIIGPVATVFFALFLHALEEQLNKAIEAIKGAAESETAQNLSAKAKQTATQLAKKAKEGALSAAEAFVEADADPSTVRVNFLNAHLSVVSPSNGLEITRPTPASIVVSDGQGNGLVINAASEKAYVTETIGQATQLSAGTYDLGPEDGENVVVIEI